MQLGHVAIFLQDYDDAESWAYLDKLICAWRRKEEETRSKCGLEPAPPYGRCQLFRNQSPTQEWLDESKGLTFGSSATNGTRHPVATSSMFPVGPPTPPPVEPPTTNPFSASDTLAPVAGGGANGTSTEPAAMNCLAFSAETIKRMCNSADPCCESTRSDTSFCWGVYENVFAGDLIKSACFHCCKEFTGVSKIVGEATVPNPAIPKTIQCSAVENPFRMCKSGGCCDSGISTSSICSEFSTIYLGHIPSICVSDIDRSCGSLFVRI
jgi:hypothetical protein